MKYLLWLGSIIAFIFFVPSTKILAGGCDESQLQNGTIAEVTPGTSNNMRTEPNPDAELIAVIPPAEPFMILAGRDYDETYLWIEISYHTAIGWTVAANCITGEIYVQQSSLSDTTSSSVALGDSVTTNLIPSLQGNHLTVAGLQMNLPDAYATGSTEARSKTAEDRRDSSTSYGYPTRIDVSNNDDSLRWYMSIYPASSFEMYWPNTVSVLQQVLSERPDPAALSSYNFHPQATNRLLQARGEYLDFDWGRGYRSIEFHTNSSFPIPPNYVQYRFYALTNNNRYFVLVHAQVLITNPASILNEMDSVFRNPSWFGSDIRLERENFESDSFHAWRIMENYLASAPESVFSLSLSSFNDWLASIQIPADLLPEAAFNSPVAYTDRLNSQAPVSPTALPQLCGASYQSSLFNAALARQALQNDPVRVRIAPAGEYAGFDIVPYEVVLVLSDPVCADFDGQAGVWWEIETVDGRRGWVLEGLGDRVFFVKFVH